MFNIKKVQHYIQLLERRGFKASSVLSGSGITKADLDKNDYMVDFQSYQVVVANMLSLTGNEALGLELGKEISFGDMGIIGYAMMSAPTISQAMALWSSYGSQLFGSVIEIEVKAIDSKRWCLKAYELMPVGPVNRFCLEEFLLMCQFIGENLSGKPVIFSKIELTYPQPGYVSQYRNIFGCELVFNALQNRLEVVSPGLKDAVCSTNAELNEMYLKFCQKISLQLNANSPLISRVQSYFLKSPDNIPTIGEIAEQMNCSERSLRRHLKQQGVTYRDLVNNFRCRLAKEYLRTTTLSSKQISYLLGYQDTKPFLRAFKSRTGMTIGEYRNLISK